MSWFRNQGEALRMSECMICKGNGRLDDLGFSIAGASGFLMRGAFWLGEASDIWTFKYI